MNWLLFVSIGVLAISLAWLGWRQFVLRRSLNRFEISLHSIENGQEPVGELPDNLPGLEDFSHSVKALALALIARTTEVEAERATLAAVLDRRCRRAGTVR